MSGFWLGVVVLIGFAVWGATLFWRGRRELPPERHETRAERRRLHHKG